MPVEWIHVDQLRVGDVVRIDDPQAQRVERVFTVHNVVVVELRSVGLHAAGCTGLRLDPARSVQRLGDSDG